MGRKMVNTPDNRKRAAIPMETSIAGVTLFSALARPPAESVGIGASSDD
jgi:hypothetical protein